jgi:hypothetical protein
MVALALFGSVSAGRFLVSSTRAVSRQSAGRGPATAGSRVMIYLHDMQQIAFIPL